MKLKSFEVSVFFSSSSSSSALSIPHRFAPQEYSAGAKGIYPLLADRLTRNEGGGKTSAQRSSVRFL